MFSDSAQVTDMAVRKFADVLDGSSEIQILIEHNTQISGSFQWASLVAKKSDWKHGKVFYPSMFMAYEEKFSFIGTEFKFVGSNPVLKR